MVSGAKMVCYKSITTELKGTRLSEEDICFILAMSATLQD